MKQGSEDEEGMAERNGAVVAALAMAMAAAACGTCVGGGVSAGRPRLRVWGCRVVGCVCVCVFGERDVSPDAD